MGEQIGEKSECIDEEVSSNSESNDSDYEI